MKDSSSRLSPRFSGLESFSLVRWPIWRSPLSGLSEAIGTRPTFCSATNLHLLAILWSAIPLVFLWLGRDRSIRASVPGAFIAYFIGILILLINATSDSWIVPNIPFLNIQWISRVLVAVSLWVGTYWMLSARNKPAGWDRWRALILSLETAGHAILFFLLFVEVNSWISSSRVFSPFMRFGFVSALWSLQALLLIGIGLSTRNQFRRITGFVIFGITVGKLLLIDMAVLQPVYRILSFAATGGLLIVAAYLYQKFAREFATLENAGRR